MFKVKIIAVGKIKEEYFQQAVAEYVKRAGRYAEVKIVEVKEENFCAEPSDKEKEIILEKEGEGILKEVIGRVFALAIEGKKLSSEGLKDLIKKSKDAGEELTFIIGGSYGLADKVKRAATLVSFSDMTFPHTLFRVMLTEQIYRAFNIMEGGKYHK